MIRIGIILGSTRPGRFGEQPATWLHSLAREKFADKAEFVLVDVKEANLPLLDEPVPAMMRQSAEDHAKTKESYESVVTDN